MPSGRLRPLTTLVLCSRRPSVMLLSSPCGGNRCNTAQRLHLGSTPPHVDLLFYPQEIVNCISCSHSPLPPTSLPFSDSVTMYSYEGLSHAYLQIFVYVNCRPGVWRC